MRRFEVVRYDDKGIGLHSGKVLEGIVFSDGTCVVRWVKKPGPNSIGIFSSFEDFEKIHIEPAPGKTRRSEVHWVDENTRD